MDQPLVVHVPRALAVGWGNPSRCVSVLCALIDDCSFWSIRDRRKPSAMTHFLPTTHPMIWEDMTWPYWDKASATAPCNRRKLRWATIKRGVCRLIRRSSCKPRDAMWIRRAKTTEAQKNAQVGNSSDPKFMREFCHLGDSRADSPLKSGTA